MVRSALPVAPVFYHCFKKQHDHVLSKEACLYMGADWPSSSISQSAGGKRSIAKSLGHNLTLSIKLEAKKPHNLSNFESDLNKGGFQ